MCCSLAGSALPLSTMRCPSSMSAPMLASLSAASFPDARVGLDVLNAEVAPSNFWCHTSSSAHRSLCIAQSKQRRSESTALARTVGSNRSARSRRIFLVLVPFVASQACRRDCDSTPRQRQKHENMSGLKGWVRCYVHVVRGNFRRRLLRTGRVEVTTSVFWTTAAEALNPSDPRLRSFEQ